MCAAKKKPQRKKSNRLSDVEIAACLVHAVFNGDDAAVEKFGISVRTLRRHRARLDTDADLAEYVRYSLHEATQVDGWMADATETIRKALGYVNKFCAMGKLTASGVMAVTEAIATLAEAELAYQMLDAATKVHSETDGSAAALDGPARSEKPTGWGANPTAAA